MRVDKKCEQRKRYYRRSASRERESREEVRVEKECEKRRNENRERESRAGVRVEKDCEVRRSASRKGMRT